MAAADGAAGFGAIQDQARKDVTQVVERVLTGQQYSAESAPEFCEHISAQAVSALASAFEGFRFAATTTILQRGKGLGLASSSAAAFDPATDGSLTVRWENQGLVCLVAVFGMAS